MEVYVANFVEAKPVRASTWKVMFMESKQVVYPASIALQGGHNLGGDVELDEDGVRRGTLRGAVDTGHGVRLSENVFDR